MNIKPSNQLIYEMKSAYNSCLSVVRHAGLNPDAMTPDEIIDKSRSISAPCNHKYDRPYKGHGTRICVHCGGLQDN